MNADGITPRLAIKLAKDTVNAWLDDYAPSMGAALAYYTMFSIAPLLLIVIAVAGLFFGPQAARGEIIGELQGLLGEDGARAIEALLKSVSEPADSLMAAISSVLLLLLGATSAFGELQSALDRIWRAPAQLRAGGIFAELRSRVLSIGMIMGIAFLLMVSLVFSAAVAALGRWWGPIFGAWEIMAQIVNFVISFALTTTMFAMIYKIMPRVKIEWRDVWTGALVTAVMFSAGKMLIGIYIGKAGIASGFGAAASLVVLLLWVYYSAQIFLLGAEFTWVYAHAFGSRREKPIAPMESGSDKPKELAIPTQHPGEKKLR
jgi:membrane protein